MQVLRMMILKRQLYFPEVTARSENIELVRQPSEKGMTAPALKQPIFVILQQD